MPRLRIATFNLSGGVDCDRRFYNRLGTKRTRRLMARAKESMRQVADLITSEELDIVALQEVDVCYSGRETFAQHDDLARRLQWHCAFEPAFDYHLGPFANVTTGLATLSKAPIRLRQSLTFPQQGLGWRGRLRASMLGSKRALHTVHDVGGVEFHVINAHLTHQVDAQKELELEHLLGRLRKLSPAVLAGDLNTTPASTRGPDMVESQHFASDRASKLIQDAQSHSPQLCIDCRVHDAARVAEVCTYPSHAPSLKLDYLIGHFEEQRYRLEGERVLSCGISNHLPTAAEVCF